MSGVRLKSRARWLESRSEFDQLGLANKRFLRGRQNISTKLPTAGQ